MEAVQAPLLRNWLCRAFRIENQSPYIGSNAYWKTTDRVAMEGELREHGLFNVKSLLKAKLTTIASVIKNVQSVPAHDKDEITVSLGRMILAFKWDARVNVFHLYKEGNQCLNQSNGQYEVDTTSDKFTRIAIVAWMVELFEVEFKNSSFENSYILLRNLHSQFESVQKILTMEPPKVGRIWRKNLNIVEWEKPAITPTLIQAWRSLLEVQILEPMGMSMKEICKYHIVQSPQNSVDVDNKDEDDEDDSNDDDDDDVVILENISTAPTKVVHRPSTKCIKVETCSELIVLFSIFKDSELVIDELLQLLSLRTTQTAIKDSQISTVAALCGTDLDLFKQQIQISKKRQLQSTSTVDYVAELQDIQQALTTLRDRLTQKQMASIVNNDATTNDSDLIVLDLHDDGHDETTNHNHNHNNHRDHNHNRHHPRHQIDSVSMPHELKLFDIKTEPKNAWIQDLKDDVMPTEKHTKRITLNKLPPSQLSTVDGLTCVASQNIENSAVGDFHASDDHFEQEYGSWYIQSFQQIWNSRWDDVTKSGVDFWDEANYWDSTLKELKASKKHSPQLVHAAFLLSYISIYYAQEDEVDDWSEAAWHTRLFSVTGKGNIDANENKFELASKLFQDCAGRVHGNFCSYCNDAADESKKAKKAVCLSKKHYFCLLCSSFSFGTGMESQLVNHLFNYHQRSPFNIRIAIQLTIGILRKLSQVFLNKYAGDEMLDKYSKILLNDKHKASFKGFISKLVLDQHKIKKMNKRRRNKVLKHVPDVEANTLFTVSTKKKGRKKAIQCVSDLYHEAISALKNISDKIYEIQEKDGCAALQQDLNELNLQRICFYHQFNNLYKTERNEWTALLTNLQSNKGSILHCLYFDTLRRAEAEGWFHNQPYAKFAETINNAEFCDPLNQFQSASDIIEFRPEFNTEEADEKDNELTTSPSVPMPPSIASAEPPTVTKNARSRRSSSSTNSKRGRKPAPKEPADSIAVVAAKQRAKAIKITKLNQKSRKKKKNRYECGSTTDATTTTDTGTQSPSKPAKSKANSKSKAKARKKQKKKKNNNKPKKKDSDKREADAVTDEDDEAEQEEDDQPDGEGSGNEAESPFAHFKLSGTQINAARLANQFLRAKSKKVRIGIERDGVHDHFTSYCQHCAVDDNDNGEDDEIRDEDDENNRARHRTPCKIRHSNEFLEREHPIISLTGPIYYTKQRLWCETHNAEVDIFDKNFELGVHDRWLEETETVLDSENGGLVQHGDYLYTFSAYRWMWNEFICHKRVNGVHDGLVRLRTSVYLHKFSHAEFVDLQQIFSEDGVHNALAKVVELVLPSFQTLSRLCLTEAFAFALPLADQLAHCLSKFGSRYFAFDATFRICKGIVLINGRRTKIALLTVKDEFGHYVAWDLLAKASEKQKYIIPVIARCVFNSLMNGPVRTDHRRFVFCSDDARRHRNLTRRIFKYIKRRYNNGNRHLTNAAGSHVYDLRELCKTSVIAQDPFHIFLRMMRDKVYTKDDPSAILAKRDYQYLMKGLTQNAKPIILNGKFTAEDYYFRVLTERVQNRNDFDALELQLARSLSLFKKHRGSIYDKELDSNNTLDAFIRSNAEFKPLAIIREILSSVHCFFWLSLFARWAWLDDRVNDHYMYEHKRIKVRYYVSKDAYRNNTFNETWISTYFVDKNLIEALLATFGFEKTKLRHYGYQSVEHYKASKVNWWLYWQCGRHYLTPACRRRLDIGRSVLSMDQAKVRKRKQIQCKQSRIQWEFNNTIIQTLSYGTLTNEFLHGYINYLFLHKTHRNITFAYIQHALIFILFNERHFRFVFANLPSAVKAVLSPTLKNELQEIYTEALWMYKRFQHRRFIKIKSDTATSRQFIWSYIVQKKLPQRAHRYNEHFARNNFLLFQWALIQAKYGNIKVQVRKADDAARRDCDIPNIQWIDSDSDSETEADNDDFDVDVDVDPKEDEDEIHELYSDLISKFDGRMKQYIRIKYNAFPLNQNANSLHPRCKYFRNKSVAKIRAKIQHGRINHFQFGEIREDLVDDAVHNLFRYRYSKKTICNKLRLLGFKVARHCLLNPNELIVFVHSPKDQENGKNDENAPESENKQQEQEEAIIGDQDELSSHSSDDGVIDEMVSDGVQLPAKQDSATKVLRSSVKELACPQDHRLEAGCVDYTNANAVTLMTCDQCNKSLKDHTFILQCQPCDFAFCSKCYIDLSNMGQALFETKFATMWKSPLVQHKYDCYVSEDKMEEEIAKMRRRSKQITKEFQAADQDGDQQENTTATEAELEAAAREIACGKPANTDNSTATDNVCREPMDVEQKSNDNASNSNSITNSNVNCNSVTATSSSNQSTTIATDRKNPFETVLLFDKAKEEGIRKAGSRKLTDGARLICKPILTDSGKVSAKWRKVRVLYVPTKREWEEAYQANQKCPVRVIPLKNDSSMWSRDLSAAVNQKVAFSFDTEICIVSKNKKHGTVLLSQCHLMPSKAVLIEPTTESTSTATRKRSLPTSTEDAVSPPTKKQKVAV